MQKPRTWIGSLMWLPTEVTATRFSHYQYAHIGGYIFYLMCPYRPGAICLSTTSYLFQILVLSVFSLNGWITTISRWNTGIVVWSKLNGFKTGQYLDGCYFVNANFCKIRYAAGVMDNGSELITQKMNFNKIRGRYIYIRTNTRGKDMDPPFLPPGMG